LGLRGKEVHDSSVNPKLDAQVDGPFQVLENSCHTLLLQQRELKNLVSSDRVTPAPTPHPMERTDPHLPTEAVSSRLPSKERTRTPDIPIPSEGSHEVKNAPKEDEYVLERIVGA
jgi:hypothetical protein